MEEIIKKAAKDANFIQWFKVEAWKLGFKGEKKLDELAIKIIDYLK